MQKYIRKAKFPFTHSQTNNTRLTLVDLRSGNLVDGVRLIVVDVVEDTRLSAAVQLGTDNAFGVVGAAARNLEVDALGVHLGLALLAGLVQSDLLVAEDVVTGGDGFGDGNLPERA